MNTVSKAGISRRKAIVNLGALSAACLLPGCASLGSKSRQRPAMPPGKFVIAHRGNSGLAPENTLAAYRLAIKDGVEYVEQDLQITKDGVLVCCHDILLNRVTNVKEVFPELARDEVVKGAKVKNWYTHDLTLKQLRQLDAGSWFNPRFKGERIPTWDEAIETIKGKAGLCPETKAPEYYGKLGFDMSQLVADTLRRHRLHQARAFSPTPVFIQSFSRTSLVQLVGHNLKWPMLWLSTAGTKWTEARFQETKDVAVAIGPFKRDVDAALVDRAHTLGFKVVPYTFRAGDATGFPNVREEMRHYLHGIGIDGLFTDNPDQFPRRQT
jgi:glycerophosphoryl diester phosphodiesterase